jgi:hypothetical protein
VKAVYVYSLCKKACEILSGVLIPHDTSVLKTKKGIETMIKFPVESLVSEVVRFIKDPRSGHGKRHDLGVVLSIAVCAVLCGCRSYIAIGAWSQSLSSEELKRFGSKWKTPPSEPTIRRVIQRINADEFDKIIGQWLLEKKLVKSPDGLKGCGIAIDGKTMRGSYNGKGRGIHLLSAIIHKEGVVCAQEAVDEKTNEIKHVRPLLNDLDIEGAVVTADALHTQKDLAKYLVKDKKAHYLLTVKDNQPTLLEDIQYILAAKKKNQKGNRISPTTIRGTEE